MLNRRELIAAALLTGAAETRARAAPVAPSDVDWEGLRARMFIPRDVAYMNTGTLGAMPRDVFDAVTEHMRAFEMWLPNYDYATDVEPPLTGYAPLNDRRAKIAELIGASFAEIAFTQNATVGMNTI